jgi:hypothetical protein
MEIGARQASAKAVHQGPATFPWIKDTAYIRPGRASFFFPTRSAIEAGSVEKAGDPVEGI